MSDTSVQELEQHIGRLEEALRAAVAIGSSLNFDDIIQTTVEQIAAVLDCDVCQISEGNPGSMDYQSGRRGEGPTMSVPLLFERSRVGTMVLGRRPDAPAFTVLDGRMAKVLGRHVATALRNARQHQELRDVHASGLRALVGALGAKERYTQGHAARVASYVALMGTELGWPKEMMQRAEEAAIMHDIGKLVVPDGILLKPGALTEKERATVRSHAETSEEIVRPLVDATVRQAIRSHHENFDGSGYPDGLRGYDIPLLARAIGVADAYDAMSFRRPYRQTLSYRECLNELQRTRGTQFDPEMVDALLKVLDDIRVRRLYCRRVARRAASGIDGQKHQRIRGREDEATPEYREITGLLGEIIAASPGIRFLSTFARVGSAYHYVADPEESEEWRSHPGDKLLVPDEEMDRAFAGETRIDRVVLNADEFGVWVSGLARIVDHQGQAVGLVCADSPAQGHVAAGRPGDRSGLVASLLGEAGKRLVLAEFDAATDGVTGLYNHRFLQERLAEEVSRAEYSGAQVAVLFLDIDHFKSFNDEWGHSLGDAVLRLVARVVEAEVRRSDVVARYGGEEFAAILPGAELKTAWGVAERIRRKVARSPIMAGMPPVTVSVGVAVFPDDGTTPAELVDRADSAMYQAKRLGRDRVHAWTPMGQARRPRQAAARPRRE